MSGLRVAFYAPMKSPLSDVPSGDRTIARLLMAALEAGGCDVRLASELRTWSRNSDAATLQRIEAASAKAAAHLIADYETGDWKPDLWFTYHVYYKAPDWLGPAVANALSVPYVMAEATYAGKRDRDAWAPWQAAARRAMLAADAVLCFTDRDREGVLRAGVTLEKSRAFPPFLAPQPPAMTKLQTSDDGPVRLITVAMMRPGDKFDSYRFLGQALRALRLDNWTLTVVGDGAARDAVRTELAIVPGERLIFAGALSETDMHEALAQADVFVWPGLGEAFGMAYLEAQAAGLPVIALDTAGVGAVVSDGVSGLLVRETDPLAFAAAIDWMIVNPSDRQRLARSAIDYVSQNHTFDVAVDRLSTIISEVYGRQEPA